MSILYMALAPTLIECDNWCEKYPFPIPFLYYLWSNPSCAPNMEVTDTELKYIHES